MALFVDGPACTIDDLTDQDTGLLEVALTNNINVSTKLRLAVEEIRTDLHLWLNKPKPNLDLLWGPYGSILRIGQIVVTPPLKRWEAMHALALVYRDAYFSQLVDRYQGKWKEYARLTRDASESFIASGVGLVRDPVTQAAPPVLSTSPGPQSGGTFYASVAWVNSLNQAGAPSYASSITVVDGNLMTVGVTGAPENAVGFNVYAGTSLTTMFLQNDVLLPVGATYLYVPGQITQGPLPGTGQTPDFTRPLARTMLRG
jgi:hypothetical protein